MTLGQRIQELRKGLGLSQEELGERMGGSRQAISKWEGDQTIPELDKLIALSKLFGLTLGQLLGVEQPAPAAPKRVSRRQRLLLAGMGAAILILAVVVGALWAQVQTLDRDLTRRLSITEEYALCSGRDLFQTAQCRLSGIDGPPVACGTQDLTLDFTLEPVEQLEGWEVIGLTAFVEGKIYPADSREEHLPTKTVRETASAALTLPGYSGESVKISASLREKETGRTIETRELFTVEADVKLVDGSFTVKDIQVTENQAPSAFIPESIFRALPDPRFEG